MQQGACCSSQREPSALGHTPILESGAPDRSLLSKRSQLIISPAQKNNPAPKAGCAQKSWAIFSRQAISPTGWHWVTLQAWGFCSPSESPCQICLCIYLVVWGKSPRQRPVPHPFLGMAAFPCPGSPWEAFDLCYKDCSNSA